MKTFEESYAELVVGRERYESQEYTFTYKDLARLITAVGTAMREEMMGHNPFDNVCLFDAGSERDVMAEQLASLGLNEYLAEPLPGMTWHLGFDINHNEME